MKRVLENSIFNSGKFAVGAEPDPADSPDEAPFRVVIKDGTSVDYWDGEE